MKHVFSVLTLTGMVVLFSHLVPFPASAQEIVDPPVSEEDTAVPSTPTNLTVTAPSSSELNLSWNASSDNVGVTGYKIYRRSASSGPDTLIATLGTVTTYEDTGFSPSTKFWYSVSAIDAAGNESGKTEIRSGRTLPSSTDTTAPSIPANLTVTAPSSSELHLSWNPATDNVGVTGYKVYRRSASTGPDTLTATLGTVTTYEDTGFSPGTKFWYSVSAIDATGNGSDKTELRSGRTLTTERGEANLPAGALGPDITVDIFSYTTSDLKSSSFRIKADGSFSIVKKSGEKVIDIPAEKNIRVSYLGSKIFRVYDPDTGTTIDELSNEVRFEAADQNTIFDVSRPNSSFDRYRGDLKLRFYDSPVADGDRIWVINTIPLEHYTWGMGEITGTGADEYDKVMTTLFRTYGYWKIKWSTKWADQGFKVNATAGDQVYLGYDWEVTHADIRKAALATQGELVMHSGKIALTAYSAWTDGATRRFEDGHWGHVCTAETGKISEIYPWLSAVSDLKGKHPTEGTCSLAGSGNHMVGLSANGALRLATDSQWKAKSIMSHYFSGVYFFKGY